MGAPAHSAPQGAWLDVLIDADVNYGDDLHGVMHRVSDSKRVLLVVDQNYVDRANNMPEPGVGKENRWIAPPRQP